MISWVPEFTGNTSKIVDALLKIAENQLAGSTIKIEIGNDEIEETNVKRSQLIEAMDKVQEMAILAGNL